MCKRQLSTSKLLKYVFTKTFPTLYSNAITLFVAYGHHVLDAQQQLLVLEKINGGAKIHLRKHLICVIEFKVSQSYVAVLKKNKSSY